MWRNYLTVAIRALIKNRTYAFINIFGLTIGLAACLSVLLYIRYELSYDSWLADADRTFQLQQWVVSTDDPTLEVPFGTQRLYRRAHAWPVPADRADVYVGHQQPITLQTAGTLSEDFVFVDGPLSTCFECRSCAATGDRPRRSRHDGSTDRGLAPFALRHRRTHGPRFSTGPADYRIHRVGQDPPRNSHSPCRSSLAWVRSTLRWTNPFLPQ